MLRDPQGPLSFNLPSSAIEAANQQVQEASQPKKRGPYNKSPPISSHSLAGKHVKTKWQQHQTFFFHEAGMHSQ